MPANRVPDYDVPLIGPGGTMSIPWWRYFSSLAGQFSGVDAPLMPVDAAGVLSVANVQPKPASLSEGRIQEIARQVTPQNRPVGRDGETADNALISLAPRVVTQRDNSALELAGIALSRIRNTPPTQPQIIVCTQATFPTLANFGPVFVYVSDFAHWIYWDGTTATFADGGSDYYIVAPSAPSSIGWHAVDGSTVNYLKADGTLTAKTLVNVAGTPAYLKVGAGADTLNAPTAPTISGVTDAASANILSSTGADNGPGTTLSFTAGAVATTVATHTHNHDITQLPHQHSLSSVNAPISATGEPENFYSKLWFRL